MPEVKLIWFSQSKQSTEEAEKEIAARLGDGWKIVAVAGGGSESVSDSPALFHKSMGNVSELRAVGLVVMQKGE